MGSNQEREWNLSNYSHMVFSEKYRPRKVADCILADTTKANLQSFVDSGKIPNLLLHGPAGTGKTTAARALCEELDFEYIVVNGSNEGRLLDTLRTQIAGFASAISFEGKRKAVILDESDYIPADTVQPALRNFIDEFSKVCTFIFTANFPNRIIEPLHSRCSVIEFSIPGGERKARMLEILKRCVFILQQEGVHVADNKIIAEVVRQNFPDFRRTINELQAMSASGTIDSVTARLASGQEFDELVEALKAGKWPVMRQWVAKTPGVDLTNLSRRLYDQADKLFKPDSIPQLVLSISEYQYKSSFVTDREIHIVAFLTNIMVNCEFQK